MVRKDDRGSEHKDDSLFEREGSCIQAEIENVDLIQAFIDILREEMDDIQDDQLPLLLKKRFGIGLSYEQIQDILYGRPYIVEREDTRTVYI